jgi:hypothetical protein
VGTLQQVYRLTNHRALSSSGLAHSPIASFEFLDITGFDFGVVYGELGSGFIFVHHRIPISVRARKGEYEVDPVRDLVPICGNCHAMVHRRQVYQNPSLGTPGGLSVEASSRLAELRGLASGDDWDSLE